jgi:hypothetical protein
MPWSATCRESGFDRTDGGTLVRKRRQGLGKRQLIPRFGRGVVCSGRGCGDQPVAEVALCRRLLAAGGQHPGTTRGADIRARAALDVGGKDESGNEGEDEDHHSFPGRWQAPQPLAFCTGLMSIAIQKCGRQLKNKVQVWPAFHENRVRSGNGRITIETGRAGLPSKGMSYNFRFESQRNHSSTTVRGGWIGRWLSNQCGGDSQV